MISGVKSCWSTRYLKGDVSIEWTSHRKKKETKHQPGTAVQGNILGCCLLQHQLHPLCTLLTKSSCGEAKNVIPTTDSLMFQSIRWWGSRTRRGSSWPCSRSALPWRWPSSSSTTPRRPRKRYLPVKSKNHNLFYKFGVFFRFGSREFLT